MTVGSVVGPFDDLTIINATSYTITAQGGAYVNPPTAGGGDNRKTLSFTSSSAVTVTIPPGLTLGFRCDIIQSGTGTVTLSPASGVVVHGGLATAQRYSILTIRSIDQDVYVTGGLGATGP